MQPSLSPMGPGLPKGIFDWPSELLERVPPSLCNFGEQRIYAMTRNSQWIVTSEYTGMGCPREPRGLGHQAVQKKKIAGYDDTGPRFLRSSDKAAKCLKLLREYSREAREGCVFADINERISEDAVAHLDGMEPTESMGKEEQVKCRQEQLEWLQQQKRELFTHGPASYRTTHQRQCHTLPQVGPDLEECTPGDGPELKAFRINVAGTCCQGLSGEGINDVLGTHRSARMRSGNASVRWQQAWTWRTLSPRAAPRSTTPPSSWRA